MRFASLCLGMSACISLSVFVLFHIEMTEDWKMMRGFSAGLSVKGHIRHFFHTSVRGSSISVCGIIATQIQIKHWFFFLIFLVGQNWGARVEVRVVPSKTFNSNQLKQPPSDQ